MKKVSWLILLCLILLSGTIYADTLELVNGKKIEGAFVGRSNGSIRFEVDGITSTYDEKDVKNITFGASEKKTENRAETTPADGASSTPASLTVPAGTKLVIRTKEPLDSSRQRAGHQFTAALEADLAVKSTIVTSRGSTVYGELIDAKQAGRLVGKSEMTITFTGLMVNNRIKSIRTSGIQAIAESGSAKNTVGKSARGAAIGGLIDGRSGAKTGAKVGLGAAILTRGGRINIPANTLLEVTLAEPFTP